MRSIKITRRVGCVVAAIAWLAPAGAQEPGHWHSDTVKAKAKTESVTVVAGKQFARGGFYRWVFGDNYRDLWTTPIRVPVLHLHAYANGLHPTKEGGGNQTKSLRLENDEGVEYVFRLSKRA